MAYEVTATRRRPGRFEDLVGQEFVVSTLKSSIENGQIAHAYLFSGPRGCGKTSSARILAKSLNCQNGPTVNPCGVCSSCKEIAAGTSLDVIEIDGASNTSVNDIRQIKDEVLYPPNSGKYKIYIIDEVHMLSTSAFNALLKTIEEPPPYIIFIFATTELHKVPATIKSRCQHFNFKLVDIEKIKESLDAACKEMNITAEEEALFWIAKESTGSMRDAYTLFDQVAAFSGGNITYEKIREKLGIVGLDSINGLAELCADCKTGEVLETCDRILSSGISIEQFINGCTEYFRSLLLIKNGITKDSILGLPVSRYSSKALESWSSIQLERALSLLLELFRNIKYSLSPRYELEVTFSRLSWLSSYVSPAEVKVALDKAMSFLGGKGVGSLETLSNGEGIPGGNGISPFEKKNSPVADTSGILVQQSGVSGAAVDIKETEEKIQNGNLSGTELEKRENPSVPDSDEKEFTEEYYFSLMRNGLNKKTVREEVVPPSATDPAGPGTGFKPDSNTGFSNKNSAVEMVKEAFWGNIVYQEKADTN